jgi:serine/threonine protein kinase
MLHRDIKPANVLLSSAEGDAFPRVLLADFGECLWNYAVTDARCMRNCRACSSGQGV